MSNERRGVIHFNVTESPTAAWTGQQIVNAFPWDTAPKYMRSFEADCPIACSIPNPTQNFLFFDVPLLLKRQNNN
jgi:hypothetical protein